MKCATTIAIKFGCAAVLGLSLISSAAPAGTPEGIWLSEDGATKVRIANCAGKLCGTLVWLDKPTDATTGKPKTDKHNPDPAKRSRPLLGLQVVRGLAPSGPDKWSGLIYNADDGRTYQAHLKVQSANAAHVEGCVLAILCKGQTWKRSN
ncbi:MAG: DUF2147 domain-containing protein [Betaproteobacteria bacterium]|nr:DUF2147 domain-containing protein [Betaproteobacteria bacterium]